MISHSAKQKRRHNRWMNYQIQVEVENYLSSRECLGYLPSYKDSMIGVIVRGVREEVWRARIKSQTQPPPSWWPKSRKRQREEYLHSIVVKVADATSWLADSFNYGSTDGYASYPLRMIVDPAGFGQDLVNLVLSAVASAEIEPMAYKVRGTFAGNL